MMFADRASRSFGSALAGACATAVVACWSAPPACASAAPSIAQILADGKAAEGGDAIASLYSVRYDQRVVLVGVGGTAEEWDDDVYGRTVQFTHAGALSGGQGFDGSMLWQQDATGLTHPLAGDDDVRGALTQAYFQSFSEFVPGRRDGKVADPRVVTKDGVAYDVITVTPNGGLPTDVYFDPTSHLIARAISRYSPVFWNETEFSDYRTVDGVAIPFVVQSQDSNGNGGTTTIVRATPGVDGAARFGMPTTPVTDFSIASGRSTTVPIQVINNHIYLTAHVDGKGPYRFIFDTGGQAVLDPDVAAKLGIGSAGDLNATGAGAGSVPGRFAWVPQIQIGGATMSHQAAAIIPLGPTMHAIEGVHIDGMVGWELAARYLVTIDYLHQTMTLAMRDSGSKPAGTAVPITFAQTLPEVHAVVDGLPGTFDIDTGNRQSLDLTSPFVTQHDLRAKYASKVAGITGYGIGGPTRAQLTRVGTVAIDGVDVPGVVTGLSLDSAGAMADPGEAGNIGGGLLKRFDVTFDYADRLMYLEPNAAFANVDPYDRSGVVLVDAHGGITAIGVLTGTPAAAAGIAAGDRILTVNGAGAQRLGLIRIRQIFEGRAGSVVRLLVQSSKGARDVSLTLRDYV